MRTFYFIVGGLMAVLSLLAAPDKTVSGDIAWGIFLICGFLCFIAAEVAGLKEKRDL